jgi:hypothetical protein
MYTESVVIVHREPLFDDLIILSRLDDAISKVVVIIFPTPLKTRSHSSDIAGIARVLESYPDCSITGPRG